MNYNELMKKFESGNISESEIEKLSKLIAEKGDDTNFENVASNAKTKLTNEDIAFLDTVGKKAVATVATTAAVGGASWLASTMGALNTAKVVIGLTASAVAISTVAYIASNWNDASSENTSNVVVNEKIADKKEVNIVDALDENGEISAKKLIEQKIDFQKTQEKENLLPQQEKTIEKKVPMDNGMPTSLEFLKTETENTSQAKIEKPKGRSIDAIRDMKGQLERAEIENDIRRQVLISRQIGIAYREFPEMIEESIAYIEVAILLAKEAKMESPITSMLNGELALSFFANKDLVNAKKHKALCLENLSEKQLQIWSERLKEIK